MGYYNILLYKILDCFKIGVSLKVYNVFYQLLLINVTKICEAFLIGVASAKE